VDVENVFIFGHSMGGSFGPMIAAENPVKGIATYGTAARTWHEYLLDSVRHQGLLAGSSFEAADESVRLNARLISLAFLEGKSAEDIKKSHPELNQALDSLFPGGMFNQKSLEFWRQLGKINMPSCWVKTKAHVLAIKGASDYVVFDSDHQLIADTMNRVKPGLGQFIVAPRLDHVFNNWATEKESQQNWPNGTFNPDIVKILKDWVEEIRQKPSAT
jgi:pimeloyl-ACP methyl ester carboxylesterase